jgi:F-type H+-transporting ATPase subunit a
LHLYSGLLSFLATKSLTIVPGRFQAAFEVFLIFVMDLVDSIAGKEAKRLYPLFIGIFMIIVVSNFMGLVPGLTAPTANLNTNMGLALIVFSSTHFLGIKKHGFFGYLWKLTGDTPLWLKPLFFMLEIINEIAKPFHCHSDYSEICLLRKYCFPSSRCLL